MCITFKSGELTAILGQNGAGKTTTINMLCGLTPATGGDARINGLYLKTQMDQIKEIMGVCPQYDTLFENLNAIEHIKLYAGIKGVSQQQLELLIDERLKAVRLFTVKNNLINTYSGG